jgi:hypothetical protein
MKPTHAAAHYRRARSSSRSCARCRLFDAPHHCTAIQDPVDAEMLCDFFKVRSSPTTQVRNARDRRDDRARM